MDFNMFLSELGVSYSVYHDYAATVLKMKMVNHLTWIVLFLFVAVVTYYIIFHVFSTFDQIRTAKRNYLFVVGVILAIWFTEISVLGFRGAAGVEKDMFYDCNKQGKREEYHYSCDRNKEILGKRVQLFRDKDLCVYDY